MFDFCKYVLQGVNAHQSGYRLRLWLLPTHGELPQLQRTRLPPYRIECRILRWQPAEQLNQIQKILTTKAKSAANPLFEVTYGSYCVVLLYVDEFFGRMVAEKHIDLPAGIMDSEHGAVSA